MKKNNVQIKELKDKKSQLLGNKKSLSLKLDILISSIESGDAPKTITNRIRNLEKDLKKIDNNIFKIDSESDYLNSRSMTQDALLAYLKEIVLYFIKMNGDQLQKLLYLVIKEITIKNQESKIEII